MMEIETPVWFYWLACGGAIAILFVKRQQIPSLLSPDLTLPQPQKGFIPALLLSWVATFAAAIAYIVLTQKQAPGSYHIPDLMLFTTFNGVLEQLMFVFWFLLGCWIAHQLKIQSGWKVFGLGFLVYSIYSALIHGLFWVNVLPPHEIMSGIAIRMGLLMVMSCLWMWLVWRYRAFAVTILMHCTIDFLSIGHLHFAWFEPYQLALAAAINGAG
jgi:chlorophyllide a hydrolase